VSVERWVTEKTVMERIIPEPVWPRSDFTGGRRCRAIPGPEGPG